MAIRAQSGDHMGLSKFIDVSFTGDNLVDFLDRCLVRNESDSESGQYKNNKYTYSSALTPIYSQQTIFEM